MRSAWQWLKEPWSEFLKGMTRGLWLFTVGCLAVAVGLFAWLVYLSEHNIDLFLNLMAVLVVFGAIAFAVLVMLALGAVSIEQENP